MRVRDKQTVRMQIRTHCSSDNLGAYIKTHGFPDSMVHVTNMGPTWVLPAPGGPHVGPMNFAIMVNFDQIIERRSTNFMQSDGHVRRVASPQSVSHFFVTEAQRLQAGLSSG